MRFLIAATTIILVLFVSVPRVWPMGDDKDYFSRDIAKYIVSHSMRSPNSWPEFRAWYSKTHSSSWWTGYPGSMIRRFELVPSFSLREAANTQGYGYDMTVYAYTHPVLKEDKGNIDPWELNVRIWNLLISGEHFLPHDGWWDLTQERAIESELGGEHPQPPSIKTWREFWTKKYAFFRRYKGSRPASQIVIIEAKRRAKGLPPIE